MQLGHAYLDLAFLQHGSVGARLALNCTLKINSDITFVADCDRQEFRDRHPSSAGARRPADVIQTWLPNHHATSGQRVTGEPLGDLCTVDIVVAMLQSCAITG